MTDYFQVERQNPFYGFGRQLTRTIRLLLVSNLTVFFFQLLLWDNPQIVQILGMIPARFTQEWTLWQPVTGLFLHANLWQLLMDLLILWFFAPDVEMALGGGRRFFSFYVVCGGLSNIAAAILNPGSSLPILGPAGAMFGILSAFATLFPNRIVTLLLFFVIPFEIKAKFLVLIFGLIEWLSLAEGQFTNIASYAGLAGIAIGFFYVRNRRGLEVLWGRGIFSRWSRPLLGSPKDKEDYIRRKIDPILEKIARQGLQSLTWRERRILRRAKTKIKSN